MNLHYPVPDYDAWMTAHDLQPQYGDEHSQADVNALSRQPYGQGYSQNQNDTHHAYDPNAAVNAQTQYNASQFLNYTHYPPDYYALSRQPYTARPILQHNSQNQNDTPYPEAPLTAADPRQGQQYGQDNGSQAHSQPDNYFGECTELKVEQSHARPERQ